MEYIEKKPILSKEELGRTIKRLALEIVEKNFGTKDLALVGIQTRGVPLAKRILAEIQKTCKEGEADDIPFGTLGITLYRDDVGTLETPPALKETEINFDLTGRKIILIDDVIYTGRTIRAALDELMDFGRPQSIQLAVVIDRGHRELPIEANFVGKKFQTSKEEKIEVELEEVDGQDRVVLKELKQ
jgi:pyrimidine operon attenuation protein / uracil phosphoribosyltransferase